MLPSHVTTVFFWGAHGGFAHNHLPIGALTEPCSAAVPCCVVSLTASCCVSCLPLWCGAAWLCSRSTMRCRGDRRDRHTTLQVRLEVAYVPVSLRVGFYSHSERPIIPAVYYSKTRCLLMASARSTLLSNV
jgi:hypothetical protein